MKRTSAIVLASLQCVAVFAAATPTKGQAAQTGTIEFVARVTPTGGRAEPVRQLAFYLLRKSFAEIQKEAEQAEPKPDLNLFIERLSVSKELKAWMKQKQSVELAGPDFTSRLRVDDIIGVPEFHEAYLKHNAGGVTAGFPAPKYRESDRQKKPEKYLKQRQKYLDALRRYFESHPGSAEGLEVQLASTNPGQHWAQLEAEWRRRVRRRTLELSQTRYLVATADTNLNGRATLAGIAPGTYWLSTLDMEAVAGDVHLRWDAPVTVRAGEGARLELSNINAVPSGPGAK